MRRPHDVGELNGESIPQSIQAEPWEKCGQSYATGAWPEAAARAESRQAATRDRRPRSGRPEPMTNVQSTRLLSWQRITEKFVAVPDSAEC